jgi:hypothetical protein
MEATSIMTLISSLNKLQLYNIFESTDENKNDYNKFVTNISEQIVSFLVNHYKCGRLDTPFWKHIHSLESPISLQKIKNTKILRDSTIKKIFGIPPIFNSIVFDKNQYLLVWTGHTIKKNKNSLI